MTKKILQGKAIRAFKEAISEVVEQHKRTGKPLAVWQNGKAIKISAAKIPYKSM